MSAATVMLSSPASSFRVANPWRIEYSAYFVPSSPFSRQNRQLTADVVHARPSALWYGFRSRAGRVRAVFRWSQKAWRCQA